MNVTHISCFLFFLCEHQTSVFHFESVGLSVGPPFSFIPLLLASEPGVYVYVMNVLTLHM